MPVMRRPRCVIVLSLLVVNLAAVARADAAPLSWTAPAGVSGAPLYNAVDCPAANLCVAVGKARTTGSVIAVTSSPSDSGSWAPDITNPGGGYGDVDCPSTDFCIATRGNVVAVSTNPASGVFTESTAFSKNVGGRIECSSAALCVANGYNNIN